MASKVFITIGGECEWVISRIIITTFVILIVAAIIIWSSYLTIIIIIKELFLEVLKIYYFIFKENLIINQSKKQKD